MTCTLQRPTPEALFDRIKTMFSANVLGGSEIVPESNEWYVVALDYAMHEEFYSIAEQQWKERDPRYACCDNLYKIAEIDGVYPRAAGYAEGYVRLTGTPNAPINQVPEMAFGEQIYRAVGQIPTSLNAQGNAVLRVRALEAGPASNKASSSHTRGRMITTIPGVDKDVVNYGGQFCGGTEQETCEEFRTRYLERKKYQPRATDAWIQQKLLEWPCATRVCKRGGACCTNDDCNCEDCYTKLEYYLFFDDTFDCGVAPQCIIDEVNDWMFGERPGEGTGQVEVGVCGRIYTAVPAVINIAINDLLCATPAQQTEIEERLRDLFKTICPSEMFYIRQVETVIAQVIGAATTFSVVLSSDDEGVSFTDCGDIDPECDVLPCFGEITYINAQPASRGCSE